MTSRITKIIGRSQRATLFLVILIATVLIVSSIFIVVQKGRTCATRKINYSELYKIAEIGSAASVIVQNDSLIVKSTDGYVLQATVAGDSFRQGVVELFRKIGVPIEFASMQPTLAETLFTYSAPIVICLLLGFIGWRVYATVNGRGGSFSLMDHSGRQNVTFADVAGVDEATAELSETIEFLRDPIRFGRLGGRVPRGILLCGPPGPAKPLLARAAAGEAGVSFLSVSGSNFQEKFAGVGAARVRRLFARARKLSPCVIFIDEIDALGRRRGRGSDSGSPDQRQAAHQLLIHKAEPHILVPLDLVANPAPPPTQRIHPLVDPQ